MLKAYPQTREHPNTEDIEDFDATDVLDYISKNLKNQIDNDVSKILTQLSKNP